MCIFILGFIVFLAWLQNWKPAESRQVQTTVQTTLAMHGSNFVTEQTEMDQIDMNNTDIAKNNDSVICPNGFSLNVSSEAPSCVDINECSNQRHNCSSFDEKTICQNTKGSFQCVCQSGFNKTEDQRCEDIDECYDEEKCLKYPKTTCLNYDGGYDCKCAVGYSGDFKSCKNDNECLTNKCDNNKVCVDTDGSFTCICQEGLTEDKNGSCSCPNSIPEEESHSNNGAWIGDRGRLILNKSTVWRILSVRFCMVILKKFLH